MNIAIVGTGSMGSIYAAKFVEAGHAVWAIDTWQEHVDAINHHGLAISNIEGSRLVSGIRATTHLNEADPCELYVIATKAAGVASAASAIAAVMPKDAVVVTIQNGLGAAERIAEHIGTDNVILGVAEGFGASIKGPGQAYHNAMKLIRLGEPDGGLTDRLIAIEVLWQNAGFNVKAFADIHQLIWEKFICNVALGGPCAVFNCTIGELLKGPDSRPVALGCLDEAYKVGLAKGIQFSFEDPVAYLDNFSETIPNAVPSLAQDFHAGILSETASINGMVPVLGKEIGLDTPYNKTVCSLIYAKEKTY